MKFRLFSRTGDALALAYRIAEEGNDVDVWIRQEDAKKQYDGILPRVDSWEKHLDKDTICLFDMVKMGGLAETLKKKGYTVYGASNMADALELNRELIFKIGKIYGLKIPEYEKFEDVDKAKEFIKSSDKTWVFKPLGNKSTTFTHVPENNEELISMLDYLGKEVKGRFILQEKIEGRELSTERYYMKGIPTNTLNSTIEKKSFTEGDKGVNTGCMGSLVWFWKKKEPKSYRVNLKKLEDFLKRHKFNAPLDLNCMVNYEDGMPYLLEATTRLGYSAIYCQLELLNMEAGKFFYNLANGIEPDINPSYDYAGSLRLSIPPYPYEKDMPSGVPILGVPTVGLDHLHLLDVKFDDIIESAGSDGVIGEVTAKDKDIEEIDKKIKDRIDELTIPNLHYRSDIFEIIKDDIKYLKEHNYFK